MKSTAIRAGLAVAMLATPSLAFAQDQGNKPEVTVGAQAGYHDLGISDEVFDITGIEVDDASPIFGGFVSVDFPLSDALFAGVEGNANFGTDALDADYGASARLGIRTENGTKFYVRGGYQWVDIDYANILDVPDDAVPAGLDSTFGDYLVGVGIDLPLGGVSLRGNVDTIAFDTVRATAGVGFRF
ncbi:hypothetical protein Ga0102493_112631 [Erythrobacter litoralis]|jgi:hypothetical protein|nr:hypothetical protein [Erythrobacter litoralis]AOL23642.1 hypothetical protein Ga0102493_112631 [Erythrobacter litoralis]MEE4337126.1 hypothetical protein [Erythrobacter sp.]